LPAMRIHVLLLLLALPPACSGLRLHMVDTSVQKPSNVALYFSVETDREEPVGGLLAEQFKIYEDGKPVSVHESKQVILNPEVSVVHYTMLLVDLSGSVTESGQLESIASASQAFTDKVAKVHQVGIYSFDGGKDIQKVVPFTSSPGAVKGALGAITRKKSRDPSTNLNGAIVKALEELAKVRDAAAVPLRFATLVVFTDGTDRSGYVTADQLREKLDATDIDIFSIGLGGEIDKGELEKVGQQGFALAENQGALDKAFNDVATRIENASKKYYLLSYCSPSRAGKHVLAIEANKDGKTGRVEHEFDATGFGPQCDPNKKPAFAIGARRKTPEKKKD
jgi:hypothetical protein